MMMVLRYGKPIIPADTENGNLYERRGREEYRISQPASCYALPKFLFRLKFVVLKDL
jgi:hypothetical protein